VAISIDTPDESTPMVEKLGLTYPVLADVDLGVTRAFGVADEANGISWPAIFLIGQDGRIAWRSLADSYKIRVGVDEILAAMPPRPPAAPPAERPAEPPAPRP
jgi:peroxiredoxin